jgi:hypothetical protein
MMSPDQTDVLGAALTALWSRADPVPDEVRSWARASLGWRRLDAELAALVQDSLAPATTGSTVRGEPSRLMSFEAGELSIDIELSVDAGTVRLMGQLAPVRRTAVTVEWPRGARDIESDEMGIFALDGLPTGLLRLIVANGDGAPPTCTEWFHA